MKKQKFSPSWYIYPHAGIALIVFSEEELSEQEVQIGKGEFIKQATQDEQSYQTSGILKMVTEYFSVNHHRTSPMASCISDYLLESPQALIPIVPTVLCLVPISVRLYMIPSRERIVSQDRLRLKVNNLIYHWNLNMIYLSIATLYKGVRFIHPIRRVVFSTPLPHVIIANAPIETQNSGVAA